MTRFGGGFPDGCQGGWWGLSGPTTGQAGFLPQRHWPPGAFA